MNDNSKSKSAMASPLFPLALALPLLLLSSVACSHPAARKKKKKNKKQKKYKQEQRVCVGRSRGRRSKRQANERSNVGDVTHTYTHTQCWPRLSSNSSCRQQVPDQRMSLSLSLSLLWRARACGKGIEMVTAHSAAAAAADDDAADGCLIKFHVHKGPFSLSPSLHLAIPSRYSRKTTAYTHHPRKYSRAWA